MKSLNVSEIAKSYEGKSFVSENLKKIAIGNGNTRAVITNRRITKSQGTLIGITEEIFNKWWDEGIYFGVFIDIDDASESIVSCGIYKDKEVRKEDDTFRFVKADVTVQELTIFRNIMDYITKERL